MKKDIDVQSMRCRIFGALFSPDVESLDSHSKCHSVQNVMAETAPRTA